MVLTIIFLYIDLILCYLSNYDSQKTKMLYKWMVNICFHTHTYSNHCYKDNNCYAFLFSFDLVYSLLLSQASEGYFWAQFLLYQPPSEHCFLFECEQSLLQVRCHIVSVLILVYQLLVIVELYVTYVLLSMKIYCI